MQKVPHIYISNFFCYDSFSIRVLKKNAWEVFLRTYLKISLPPFPLVDHVTGESSRLRIIFIQSFESIVPSPIVKLVLF